MGKAAKLKKIRSLASQMPAINTKGVEVSLVYGYELIAKGIKEVGGKPVDPKEQYRQKRKIPVSINHNKKMKQLYNMNGLEGVKMYVNAVNQYMQKKKKTA